MYKTEISYQRKMNWQSIIILLKFVAVNLQFSKGQDEDNFSISSYFINDESFCLSSLTQKECPPNEFLVPKQTFFGCPGCKGGIQATQICSDIDECAPGLKCTDGLCDLDKVTCSYTYHLPLLSEEIAKIDPRKLPTCEIDGTFAAVQCKGDRITGRCLCYAENGKRIYGWSWWKNIKNGDMACACSRLKYKMEMKGQTENTLHCDQMGNFEELQCNGGICWCANKLTGEMQNGTRAVPEAMWKILQCYDSSKMGKQYLRHCESAANAQNLIKMALQIHGTSKVEFNNIVCDYDGAFGYQKNLNGRATCQWRDGTNIGSFAVESNKMSTMNCYCARDQKIFAESGIDHRLTCNGVGNYESIQDINGKIFCVDRDGFAVNEAIITEETIDCTKFIYYEVKLEQENKVENNYGYYDNYDKGDKNDKEDTNANYYYYYM